MNIKAFFVAATIFASTAVASPNALDGVTYRQFDNHCTTGGPGIAQFCRYYVNGMIDGLRSITRIQKVSEAVNLCPDRFSWEKYGYYHKQMISTELADKMMVGQAVLTIFMMASDCVNNNDIL